MTKRLAVLFVTMGTTCFLFSESSSEIKLVSDCDFRIIANDGTELWLLEDIDKALTKFNLIFDGIEIDPSDSNLDIFRYSNNDIEIASFRAWKNVDLIILKSNKIHLNRSIKVGESIESIYENFPKDELLKTERGLYVIYMSDDEEGYYFPVYIIFIIKNNIIEKIVLKATSD